MSIASIEIIVNGEPRRVDQGTTLSSLFEALDLRPQHVAVEVNRHLVPRREHASRTVNAGDQLEIVSLAGGG